MTLHTDNVYTTCETHIMDNCTSGEILREVVLSLRNGYQYPISLHRLGLLGYERYGIAIALINHYHANGECDEMHALAAKISEIYPDEVFQLNALRPHDTKDLREALAFCDLCRSNPDAVGNDASERLIETVRKLLQQDAHEQLIEVVRKLLQQKVMVS